MNILYIIIGLVANAVGWWHDYNYSSRFIYYRASEGHSWFTDKHGFMSKTKPFIGLAIEQGAAVLAAMIAVWVGYPDEAALTYMGVGIGAGVAHYLQAKIKLTKRLKKDRQRQIIARQSLKQFVDPNDRTNSVERLMWNGLKTIKSNKGRYWHPSVQFLYVDATDLEEARRDLAERLYDWLLLPDYTAEDPTEVRREKLMRIWHDLKFHPNYEK